MVASVKANESKITNDKWDYNSPYNHQRPITFTERGIKFYISQNGNIDFKKPHTTSYYGESEYYYRNGRKIKKHRRRNNNRHYGQHLNIRYDFYGRVQSVNNVFIHYNYYGKVTNIGSVFMHYRRNLLTRVGGLQILRNHYGDIRYVGHVKPQNYYYNTGYYGFYNDYFYDDFVYDYEDDFFFDDDFEDEYEQFEEDDDYFYYRSKSKTTKRSKTGKTESKPKMIKRKKVKKLDVKRPNVKKPKKRKRH